MTGQARDEGVSVKRSSTSREFKDDRVLEADNVFARQGWEGCCSESLIIDEERRFPHRKDRYGFCIGVPCRDALVGLLDYIDKKRYLFLTSKGKIKRGFFSIYRKAFKTFARHCAFRGEIPQRI